MLIFVCISLKFLAKASYLFKGVYKLAPDYLKMIKNYGFLGIYILVLPKCKAKANSLIS